jgi:2-polyprenyl-3-methyl-5-hydroxy-6-metoxy-1,4-benzoquinol methylase
MELSPQLYHKLVRPQWLTNLYINDLITNHFEFKDEQVLDFGCGIGASCSLTAPDNYIGLDPDEERIDYARNLYPEYNFYPLKKPGSLDLASNSFDYILLIAVLHHIPKAQLTANLQQFHEILKPEGTIIVIEPCLTSNSKLRNHFMCLIDNGDYIRTRKEYLNLFAEQDYQTNLIK